MDVAVGVVTMAAVGEGTMSVAIYGKSCWQEAWMEGCNDLNKVGASAFDYCCVYCL